MRKIFLTWENTRPYFYFGKIRKNIFSMGRYEKIFFALENMKNKF